MLLKFCRLIWRNHVMHEAGYIAWVHVPFVGVVMVDSQRRVWRNGDEVKLLDVAIAVTIVTLLIVIGLYVTGAR